MGAGVRVAGAAIVFSGDRVLLARRNPKLRFFGGFESFIGGALESGESPLEAMRRELEEEVGLRVPVDRPMFSAGIITTPPFSPVRFETHFFAIPWDRPEFVAPCTDELVAAAWDTAAGWLAGWRRRELKIPPPVLHVLRLMAQFGMGPETWERCRAEAEAFRSGKLHQIWFAPGLLMAPLATPTLPPATHTNCYILGERRGLIVDPASADEGEQARLDALLQEVGFRPEAVVLTHHHIDHSAGAKSCALRHGVPLLASAATAALVSGVEGVLGDGQVLTTDVEPWELLLTPGHAPGHLCFLGRESRSLIAGDMVSTMSTIIIDPPEGHMASYFESLERLRGLDLEALYPSHGPPAFAPREVLDFFIAHRRQREAGVLAALSLEARELGAIVARAYVDTDPKLWPIASRSALAHLIHLEEQGRAERLGADAWRSR